MTKIGKTRLSISKADIVKHFDSLENKCLDIKTISAILEENRDFWRLGNVGVNLFIDYLIEKGDLKKHVIKFKQRTYPRFSWGDVSAYKILLSIHPKSYLSHYTAMYFHGLTDQLPKTIYLNIEQKLKGKTAGGLTQERITAAFKKTTRLSTNIAAFQNYQIRLLNGKNTENTGVVDTKDENNDIIRITDLERTLIDIAVRPEYAGGPTEVLHAYKAASDKISVNRLAATLKKIDYTYPYHQVIGFYMEKCGAYRESQIELLKKIEMKYDFYLMHKTEDTKYSKEWRLFYPKGMA
jgi:predicted transcriptional regulator of viral defense system